MVQEGQILKLSDNKEYIVINKMSLHNINYLYLVTTSKPLEIVIATEKNIDGNIVLEEIKDNSELDYVLSKFALEPDDSE